MRLSKIIKSIFFVLLLISIGFIHFFVPRIITEIKNPVITFLKKKAPLATDSLSTIDFTFASFDNTVLSCNLYLTNQKEAKGTIILLHGIRSNKSHFNKIRHRISKMGFHSIALDSRGHNSVSYTHLTLPTTPYV